MTFTATPEPGNEPPRIRFELNTDTPTLVFSDLTITRDGKPIREQPILGAAESFAFDYEMPYGVPVQYLASGTYVEPTDPDWTETWIDLSNWTGDTADWSAGSGQATSEVINADITRAATGEIQSVSVDDPQFTRYELLDAGDVVLASISVEDKVTLIGLGTPAQALVPSSFTLLLTGGVITATGATWSLSANYAGEAMKLRIVSRGRAYITASTFAPSVTWSPRGLTEDSSGNFLVIDYVNKRLRKFTSLGVEVTTGGFPINTVGEGRDVCVDASGNIYVTDSENLLVRKFSSAGVAGITWGTSNYPYGIAYNPSTTNIHVSRDDGGAGSMRRYTTAGTPVGSSTSTGGVPRDVHVDAAGKSYVTDATSDQIKVYNSTPSLILTINVGTDIRGVTTDSDGNIFVTCPEEYSVRKYTAAGVYVTQFATIGRPYGIAFDTAGDPLVSEYTSVPLVRHYATTDASVGEVSVTPQGAEQPFEGSAIVSIDSEEAWLLHPSTPSLSVPIQSVDDSGPFDRVHIEADTAETKSSDADSHTHWLIGRSRPVVITNGPRRADRWTMLLHAPTIVAKNAVRNLVDDQSVLLLRAPDALDWDLPDGWYSVGDVKVTRDDVPAIDPATMIELPLTPVDEPIVRRGVQRTYADLLSEYGTYQDLLEANTTYLDVLAG